MDAVLGIAALWIAFAASHMLLSSARLRPRLVGAIGERPFLGLYSLVAFATFVPLVWLYFRSRHAGPFLYYLGASTGARWMAYALMAAAFALVVAGALRPSPASVVPGRPEPGGVQRLTRHPVFMGIGLFGVAHLLAAPVNAAELAFFGGFPLFALLGSWHQDARKLAAGGVEFRHFHGATVFLPFSAPGEIRSALQEDAIPIGVGVLLAILLRTFHAQLFG